MIKICILSVGHSPLDSRIYYREVVSLKKKYDQIFLVMSNAAEGTQIDEPEIHYIPLKMIGKTNSMTARLFAIPEAIWRVLRLRPQVCHIHDFELVFALPFLRLFSRAKIIYDVHEAYPEMALDSTKLPHFLRPWIARIVDVAERGLASLTDYIITADEGIRRRFLDSRYRVSVIYNYPRLSLFTPDEKSVIELKQRYRDRCPIIYCGSMSQSKGLLQMLESMQILKRERPDILLILIGYMPKSLEKRVRDEIERLDIQNVVDIRGRVPHPSVVNYISIARIGLIANLPIKKWHKNVPVKQFEYMACGVPVLGADLPPIASYVIGSGCGRTFDATSSESLASEVINMLQDESEWQRMSEAGKEATRNRWNWNNMEKRLLLVYEELLNGYDKHNPQNDSYRGTRRITERQLDFANY